MADGVTVRTAAWDDLPTLLELYRHLVPDDPLLNLEDAADRLERLLRYEGSAIYIAVKGARAVSTCTLIVVPNLTRGGASYALIENVVTHAEHRGHGYGKAVLEIAITKAWELDCYKVMLLTGSKDPATLGFYQSVGFKQTKTGFETRRLPRRES